MTREMQKRIKQTKENAAILIRYANPRSKSKPAFEQVKEILSRHIPYCGGVVPAIVSVEISEFHRNSIIKSAYFIVTVENGKKYKISAYENLTGRTPEQKEADKNADFPSGLFRIFHDEIKEESKEKGNDNMKVYELTPGGYDRAKSFYGKAKVIETDGETLLQSYDTTVCKIDKSGEFVRMWSGYSATTMRHINAFIEMFGISGGGKKWWDALPVEEKPRGGADMTPAESLKAMYARRAANY
jgi:hypothetical protein